MENYKNIPEGWKNRKMFLKDGKKEIVPEGWKIRKIFLKDGQIGKCS